MQKSLNATADPSSPVAGSPSPSEPPSDSSQRAGGPREDWLSPFGLLDEALMRIEVRQHVIRLWSDNEPALQGVASHLRRRCALARLPTLIGSRFPGGGAVCDLSERLGFLGASDERRPSVSQLLEHLTPWLATFHGVCALYVGDTAADHMLLEALEHVDLPCLVVAFARRPLGGFRGLPHSLAGDDLRRWWEALAAHASIHNRDVSWQGLLGSQRKAAPSAEGSALLAALQLAGRPWPSGSIEALGSQEALAELLDTEIVELRDGLVEPLTSDDLSCLADPDDVARALCDVYPRDAMALQRAAQLKLRGGDREAASRIWLEALDACATHRCRAMLWAHAAPSLPSLGRELETELRLSAAERCMDRGDTALALQCSESAGDTARALLVRGRAALGQGDLAGACAAFEQAERFAERQGDTYRTAVARTLLAEVELSRGHYEDAEDRVADLLTHHVPAIQFSARNVAGKVLLARSEWHLAEKHFAADAADAALAGEHTEVLKARVNRSVALLALGQLALAESELRRVLNDSERLNNPRAAGYALSNLSVLHMDRREYTHALAYLERALDTHLQVGHRTAFAHDVTNLVELRLRMGHREEAEQALRFARRALDEPPVTKLCALGLAEARVALETGDLLAAKRALANAKRHADVAASGDKAGECNRMAVRVALAEGYLEEASDELEMAKRRAVSDYAKAEVALLTLLLDQNSEGSTMAQADAAVGLARGCGDEELMREAHQAAARVAYARDKHDRALFHADKSLECQHAVASRLGDPARFLLRSDHLALSELAALLREQPLPEVLRYPEAESQLLGTSAAALGLGASLEQAARVPTLVIGEAGSGRRYTSWLLHRSLHARAVFVLRDAPYLGADELDRLWIESTTRGPASQHTLVITDLEQLSSSAAARLSKRLASTEPGPWVIATSGLDLDACSPDLLDILGRQTLRIPALRQRLSDLGLLARHLLQRIARQRRERVAELDEQALRLLRGYDWPGNLAELEVVLRRATLRSPRRVDTSLVLAASSELSHNGRRFAALQATGTQQPGEVDAPRAAFREIIEAGFSLPDVKRNVERECIVLALRQTSGNITRAAQLLGMKRPRLSQLVKQYALVELCSHFAPSTKKPTQGRNAS